MDFQSAIPSFPIISSLTLWGSAGASLWFTTFNQEFLAVFAHNDPLKSDRTVQAEHAVDRLFICDDLRWLFTFVKICGLICGSVAKWMRWESVIVTQNLNPAVEQRIDFQVPVLTQMWRWSKVPKAWTGERHHRDNRRTCRHAEEWKAALSDGCWVSLDFSTYFWAVLFCRCACVPASPCSSTFCSKAINLVHFLISSLWEGSVSMCTVCPANMCMEQGLGDY